MALRSRLVLLNLNSFTFPLIKAVVTFCVAMGETVGL